jgi:HAD superfamily hydrolase (TIGR01484 family)
MQPAHIPLFERLCAERDVIVVSGAEETQMRSQLPPEVTGTYHLLTQNGNHAIANDGTILWSEGFTEEQKTLIRGFIRDIHDEIRLDVRDENDLVEDRGSQISYSLIGHHEELETKRAFDPDGEKRKSILAARGIEVQHLLDKGIEITVGGTTCFDIFQAGKNKGYNIARFLEHMRWQQADCLYFGDALEPGRNDHTVVGVIPTQAVKDSDDTFEFIKKMLK